MDERLVEVVAARLCVAISKTAVGVSRRGPRTCPLTADELRYLAAVALAAASEEDRAMSNRTDTITQLNDG